MAQSVELVLDPAADDVVRAEWDLLADAGLPSERRSSPSEHHRPHVTLYAGDVIAPETEQLLPSAVAGLDLHLVVGSPLVFGPHGRQGGYVLVRQVMATVELLELQNRVASMCGAEAGGQFGAGLWSPHVTLARRASAEQVGKALVVLAGNRLRPSHLAVRVTKCRRWDGTAQMAWWITG
jgi:2'-5' RNA ligase